MKAAVKQQTKAGVSFLDIFIVATVISAIIAAVQLGYYYGLIKEYSWNY